MDYHNLCYGCFDDSSRQNPCPTCGYSPDSNPGAGLYLTPGTLLFGKYLVGRVLGQGGFGITYLGWDTNLDIRIAIKEFFPQGLVSRVPGKNNVISYTGEIKDQFSFGVESFLRESKTLARFEHHPNIVTVRDFFKENNTAYMVMSFIEGITLLEHLNRSGGRIPVEQAVQIIMPVLDALREVHRAGIMHRDISPDNIFIDREGRITLIDFGAARQEMREKSKSLSVILKAGYAPEEQYRSKGKQGPWTDIYAIGATLYRAITGETPPEAMDRLDEDDLVPPSQQGVVIDPKQEQALLRALAVKAEERFQTVEELQSTMLHVSDQAKQVLSNSKEDSSAGDQDQHFRTGPIHGKNIEKEILLSRLEADLGVERSIIINFDSLCLECGGTGLKYSSICSTCKGKGKELKQRTISFKTPAKAEEGMSIHLKGKGGQGLNGGTDGDLYLKVKLEKHEEDEASNSQVVLREKEAVLDNKKASYWDEKYLAYYSQQAKQQHYSDIKQKATRKKVQAIRYLLIASVVCIGLLILGTIFFQYDGKKNANHIGSTAEEMAQTIIPSLKADYFIDYANGTIPIGDLPIGARVVDPSWEWEYRLGLNYSDEGWVLQKEEEIYRLTKTGESTPPGEFKPVTWLVVSKDHYDGLDPHVTLLAAELIGSFTFDDSTDRDHEYAEYGYNHWGESGTGNATHGLRPWLNSTGIHSGEGFYQAFSESFKRAVLTTTLPNRAWEDGSVYSTSDHVLYPLPPS